MDRRKKTRKKTDSKTMEQIAPALIPAASLTAVPRSPRPPPGQPVSAASGVSRGSFPARRVMGDAGQGVDDGAFSDPESSLYDYQMMADDGSITVGFGTWPYQNRRRGDRDMISTPSFVRKTGNVGRFTRGGDYQQALDTDDEGVSESDLYPASNRGKSPRRKGDDTVSLDRTQRDVRAAMQAVHDSPVEDTIQKLSASRPMSSTYPGSTSGRGTMRKDVITEDVEDDEDSDEATPPAVVEHISKTSSEQTKAKALFSLKRDMASSAPPAGDSGSGRLSSRGSRTPRDSASFSLEMEIHRLKGENEQLDQEVSNLRKVAAAIRVGDEEGAQTLMQNMQLDELKEENEVLKSTVGRLNQELSRYQAKFRPLSDDDRSKLLGLPSEGPVPSWLINKRYLAPLFLAYDDLIAEKEEVVRRCQEELQALKTRAEEVVRENQRHQLQGGTQGGVDVSDWQELQEQARLVLEENQVLMEQLEVQHNRIKDLCSTHVTDMSRLTKKATVSETEKEEAERELEETKLRYKEVKHKYDNMLLDAGSHMTLQDHINTVADLKKSVVEEKEIFEKEKEKIANKLKASEEERKHQTLAAIEVEAENKQLRAQIRALHKAVRRSQNKMFILQKAVQQSENKELVTQNELANVIKIVEKTALERDTAFKVVKEQQKDCKDTVDQMVGNSVVMGKMEEKLKMYKMKASSKLQTVADRLKEQDDGFNRQRQEYEREIRYLRLLLQEKEGLIVDMEGVKKGVEEDLETMWQAASQENRRLKDAVRNSSYKLRQHSSLRTALDEEEQLEQLVHFSE